MFTTELELLALPQPDQWRVMQPLVWKDYTYGSLTVPAGFQTDLASTPFHIADNGPARRPAAMHDWLYGSNEGRTLGKAFADSFLRDALLAEKSGRFMAWTFYFGVHFFGRSSWETDGERLLHMGTES